MPSPSYDDTLAGTGAANPSRRAGRMWGRALQRLRGRGRDLVLVSLLAKAIVAVAYAPLGAAVLHAGLWASGDAVVTDLGLLSLVGSPIALAGAVAAILLAASGALLELMSMVALLRRRASTPVEAVSLAFRRTRVTAKVVTQAAWDLGRWIVPTVVLALAPAAVLLSGHDINYYLAERPPAFWAAGVVLLLAGLGVACVLGLRGPRWLAAPAWVVEGAPASETADRARAAADAGSSSLRHALAWWVAGSVVAPVAVSMVGGGLVALVAPWWPRSLVFVAIGLGIGLAAAWFVGVACAFLSTVTLAGLATAAVPDSVSERARAGDSATPSGRTLGPRWTALVGLAALLVIASVGFAAVALNRLDTPGDVSVIAHRGAALVAPENTLASVEAAIAEGADWVEIDVQETRDGEVIVAHDSDFMRAAGVATKVWEITTEELSQIDVGRLAGPDYAGERVPTLAAVLDACRDRVGVLIELKYYGHNERLEQRVVDRVEAAGMQRQVRFMSLDRAGVARLRAIRPDWEIGLLLSVYVGKAGKLDADFLAMNASFLDERVLREARREGRDVFAWTVNDPAAMASLASRGVAGLITDDPAMAQRTLQEWRDLSPSARLLLDVAGRFTPAGESTRP